MSLPLALGAFILVPPALVVLLPSLLVRGLLAPLNPGVIFCVPGGEKRLALTIDDGPSGPGSEALLTLLRQLEVPATFFLIGSHLGLDHRFARRALQQGHTLGNHLWRDEPAAALCRSEFVEQLGGTARAIEASAAPQAVAWRWFRPGGGWFHRPMLAWLAGGPYRLVLGSIFPWDTLRPPLWFVTLFVRLNAHPGGILVLHDTPALSGRTDRILRRIVPDLRRRGYRFVPLAELLDPGA
ncbi:chitin deacetylase family protein [Synechococcus sp. CCY 9618]|uniref:chitin deacetylase family protein n=1 Tax=Synechococcus sp. CCY 9618 TaxID=2815602 RepID=UPI001C24EBDD|nr:chitin deacetylase family protein [Synechococcus sp. CCY 9618]